MGGWKESTGESRERWERISAAWDERMGGNRHSLELVFPGTERYLDAKPGERILDAACGNGTFARRLARLGCSVLAFDYSGEMIRLARERGAGCEGIDYRVLDATDSEALAALGEETFDKAVCNMAVHDISDVAPLFRGVYRLLKPGGVFVFSAMHPCFRNAGVQKLVETSEDADGIHTRHAVKVYGYITPEKYYGYAVATQPVAHLYYHRPLESLLGAAFVAGFAATGFSEPVFDASAVEKGDWTEIPAVVIIKLTKNRGGDNNHV